MGAFRADVQGGQNTGAPMGLANLQGSQAVVGIEKTLKWKFFFFAGAVIVVVSTIISIIGLTKTWAPGSFITNIFLLCFGILMMILDSPIPHPHKHLVAARDHAYKFVLFMTRFMGRGMWYLFLSTMVFAVLWDTKIDYIFGGLFTTYLVILGVAALVKGWLLSHKLESVRQSIKCSGRGVDQYFAHGQTNLSKAQFQAMVEATTNQPTMFSPDDLDYIINALSFTPYNDGQVSRKEWEYWLLDGPMLMV